MQDIIESQRGLTSFNLSFVDTLSTYGSIIRIFGVRTGEAGKRQPDNFQGLKAGRSVKVSGFFFLLPDELLQAEGERP